MEGRNVRTGSGGPRWLPALALALTALGAVVARAPAADAPPDPAQLMDRTVEATGGKAAFDSVQNRVVKGTLSLPGPNLTLFVTEYRARPRLSYMVAESPTLGRIESGVSGDVAWESTSMGGPRIKEGSEELDALREANFDAMSNWRRAYPTAELAGEDTVHEKPCWRVKLTPRFGKPRTLSIDRATGLVVKVAATAETQSGAVPVVTVLDDYRRVGAVLLPFRSQSTVAGQTRELRIDSIQQNVPLPAGRFDPPAEVKKLIDARSK